MSMKNSGWFKWENRKSIPNINEQGVYFIALTDKNIEGESFSLIGEIIYIGLSISKKGLGSRLDQFRRAMEKNADSVHGGAERVRFKHRNCTEFFANTYVSLCSVKLSPTQNTANDWRLKGDCVKHEYVSFANYMDKHGALREFNDQTRSKKK